jgi:hypothetical protein
MFPTGTPFSNFIFLKLFFLKKVEEAARHKKGQGRPGLFLL